MSVKIEVKSYQVVSVVWQEYSVQTNSFGLALQSEDRKTQSSMLATVVRQHWERVRVLVPGEPKQWELTKSTE